jgi:heme oxygenase
MTADTGERFSQTIRAASWALHGSAEGAHFMRDLLEGQIERERYAIYVGQLHHVYTVLEQAAAKMREQPIAAPFVREELTRVPALEEDLRYFFGDDWSSHVHPNAATESYTDRLREVAFTWPGGFVAHHYTRYLGVVVRRRLRQLALP